MVTGDIDGIGMTGTMAWPSPTRNRRRKTRRSRRTTKDWEGTHAAQRRAGAAAGTAGL